MKGHIFVIGNTKFISANNRHDYKKHRSLITGRFHIYIDGIKTTDDAKVSLQRDKIDYIIWKY